MNDLISLSLQAAGVVLAADFAAGLVHWMEDAYIREDTPWLGGWIGRPNIVHHHLPRRMTRNTWWESNKELLVAMGALIIAAAWLGCLTWHVWLFALVGGNANEVHKWSHRTRRENGRFISMLQDLRILQTPQHHTVHHTNPKEVHYCPVTNALNPVLDALHFWVGLEWLLAHTAGLKRQPDSSVPGQGIPPEWIAEMRRAGCGVSENHSSPGVFAPSLAMFGHLPGPTMCCQKAASLYRAHFCGLGTSLHRHYGAWARWLVNRDSAFLTLLGSAMAEAPPELCQTTCCNAFATPRDLVADSPVLQYSAAVTVCGLSAKLDDDAQDERGWRRHAARVGSKALDRPIGDALGLLHAMRFPVHDVRGWMAGQRDIEHPSASLDACAGLTCAAYGEIVGHLAQVSGAAGAKPLLQQLGESLGFLIYAQDAWEDWARDKKRGQFNPLHAFPDLAGRRAALLPALEQALASLRRAFDALPLRRHRDLLRSVLIAGAEARVAQVAGKGEKGTKHVQSPIEGTERKRSCWDKCDGCNCCECCDVVRCCRPGSSTGGSSMIDCNPCDGDGCGCCGCDC